MLSSEMTAMTAFYAGDVILPVDGSNMNHLKSRFSGATPYQQSEDTAFTVIAKIACKDWWDEMPVCGGMQQGTYTPMDTHMQRAKHSSSVYICKFMGFKAKIGLYISSCGLFYQVQ